MAPLDLGDVFVLKFNDLHLDKIHSKCLVHCKIVENWVLGSATEKKIYATIAEDDDGTRMKLVVIQAAQVINQKRTIYDQDPEERRLQEEKEEREKKEEEEADAKRKKEILESEEAKKAGAYDVILKKPKVKVRPKVIRELENDNGDALTMEDMHRMFPPGTRITLKEPWFKILFDGTHGIRIEDKNMMKGTVIEKLCTGREDTIENQPQDRQERAKLLQKQGAECVKQMDYTKALELYNLGIQLDDAKEISHLLYSNRSLCYFKLKKYSDAVREAEKAIKLNPKFLKAYCRGAEGLIKMQKFAKSIELLLSIPDDILPPSSAEEKILRDLLQQGAALPSTPNDMLRVLDDTDEKLHKLSPAYFMTVVDHTTKSFLLTGFQSGQRKKIDMSDEDLDEMLTEMSLEEARDDLEKRKKVKEAIQETAQQQENELLGCAPRYVAMLEKYAARYKDLDFSRHLKDAKDVVEANEKLRKHQEQQASSKNTSSTVETAGEAVGA